MKILNEHNVMYKKCENIIIPMEIDKISKLEMKNYLKNLKNNKSAGPDKIKPKFLKIFAESNECIDMITECFNKEIHNDKITESWKQSKTKLIEKNK